MSAKQCPSKAALSQAVGEQIPAGLARHLAACPRCQTAWTRERQVVDRLRQIPKPAVPSLEKTARMREALLVAAAREAASGVRWPGRLAISAAAAVVVALVGALVVGRFRFESPAVHRRASVYPSEGAVFNTVSSQPDELIRLFDGVVTVTVEPLRQGERFRVITGDAEIEVVGTVFEVSVKDDRLVFVRVLSGIVEVRPENRSTVVLMPHERWTALESLSSPSRDRAATAPCASTTPPDRSDDVETRRPKKRRRSPKHEYESDTSRSSRAERTHDATSSLDRTEVVFNRAWSAFRQGAFADAARDFKTVLDIHRDGTLTEDAAYWYGVALYRSGDRQQTEKAMRTFLEQYPSSGRRFAISNRLGRLALDAGRTDEAVIHFTTALKAPDFRVRRTAEEGLQAIRQRR